MEMLFRIGISFLILSILIPSAHAIPPPQLLLPLLQSIAQFFGILIATMISYLVHLWQFLFQTLKQLPKMRKTLLSGTIIMLLLFSGFITFHAYQQKGEWEETLNKDRLATLAVLKEYENITDKSLLQRYVKANFEENETAAAETYFTRENTLTAEEFMELKKRGDPLVIDIRDEAGWKAGRIPNSIHSRLADFIREDWKTLLPEDKSRSIVLVCYSGTTGALTTEFLKEKGYHNSYFFKGGVFNAYKYQIPFNGTPYFMETLSQEVKFVHTEDSMRELRNSSRIHGIDVRPQVPNQKKVIDSTPFFRELRTSEEVNEFISGLEPNVTYYSICDSPITCYSARVMNYQLQQHSLKTQGLLDLSKVSEKSELIR